MDIWVTCSWRDIIPKTVFFFQSLTVDFSYMVHCRDPIFFPVALNYLLTPGNVFFVTLILDRGPMLLWGKMCPYLLSKHTFYPIATQCLQQGLGLPKIHFLVLKGNSKPQEKNLGLYSAPCRRNQLSNFEKNRQFLE